jgi:ankyrin repeat protein
MRTALHLAAASGPQCLEYANLLLQAGAHTFLQDKQGNTPVHLASIERHALLLKAILHYV